MKYAILGPICIAGFIMALRARWLSAWLLSVYRPYVTPRIERQLLGWAWRTSVRLVGLGWFAFGLVLLFAPGLLFHAPSVGVPRASALVNDRFSGVR
jgi:hypothetical protein